MQTTNSNYNYNYNNNYNYNYNYNYRASLEGCVCLKLSGGAERTKMSPQTQTHTQSHKYTVSQHRCPYASFLLTHTNNSKNWMTFLSVPTMLSLPPIRLSTPSGRRHP